MESTTYIKNLRISPKKLRFLLPEIKKRKPFQILPVLQYTPNKGARVFYKAIKSAVTNAKTALNVSDNLLKFKVLTVEEGLKQKRWRPGGRGTAAPYRRRFAHIKIVLELEKQTLPVAPKIEKKVTEEVKVETKAIKQKIRRPNVKKSSKSKVQK